MLFQISQFIDYIVVSRDQESFEAVSHNETQNIDGIERMNVSTYLHCGTSSDTDDEAANLTEI